MTKKKYYRYENQSDSRNVFVLREKLLYGKGTNCFETEAEAKAHFETAEKIAREKHNLICEGLSKLKKELGEFYFDYFLDGDTHGIYDSGLYIYFPVNGYYFRFPK